MHPSQPVQRLSVQRPSLQRWRPALTTAALALAAFSPLVFPRAHADAPTTTIPSTAPATMPMASAAPTTDAATQPDDKATEVTVVSRGSLHLMLTLDGVFVPQNPFEVKLQPKAYSGDYIIIAAAAPGSVVKQGDVLLQLKAEPFEREISSAVVDLTTAQASLDKAKVDELVGKKTDEMGLIAAEQDMDYAQANLKHWDNLDGSMFLLAAHLNTDVAQFEFESAADELDQLKKMYKSEDLTNETADIVMKRSERTVEIYKKMVQLTDAGAQHVDDLDATEARLMLARGVEQAQLAYNTFSANASAEEAGRDAQLAAAEVAVDTAKHHLNDLQDDSTLRKITAPFDGVVEYGSFAHKAWTEVDSQTLAVGQKVTAGQALMTELKPGALSVIASCPESQVTLLPTGTHVTIVPAAIGSVSYDGVCQSASMFGAAGGDGQAFDIPMTIGAADVRLAPGFKADVHVDAGKRDHVLLVPATAVSRGVVWVRRPAAAGETGTTVDEPRLVTVGQSDGFQMEILSGLKEGEKVLTQAKKPGQS
jgi:HlyD family secretion protein